MRPRTFRAPAMTFTFGIRLCITGTPGGLMYIALCASCGGPGLPASPTFFAVYGLYDSQNIRMRFPITLRCFDRIILLHLTSFLESCVPCLPIVMYLSSIGSCPRLMPQRIKIQHQKMIFFFQLASAHVFLSHRQLRRQASLHL